MIGGPMTLVFSQIAAALVNNLRIYSRAETHPISLTLKPRALSLPSVFPAVSSHTSGCAHIVSSNHTSAWPCHVPLLCL